MGLELLEAFKTLSNCYIFYPNKILSPKSGPSSSPTDQSLKIAILKRRRKIFCFKNPNHGKCKQSAMFSMSRNQISCGISSLAFPRKLSVHDTQGNCLSGCTRCKRCLGGILRKVFKVFDFEAIPKSPSENSAKSCWRESIITRSITMANRDSE